MKKLILLIVIVFSIACFEKVELENHYMQPVGFYNIEEKKFLLHFYGGGQPDQLYILEIVDGDL